MKLKDILVGMALGLMVVAIVNCIIYSIAVAIYNFQNDSLTAIQVFKQFNPTWRNVTIGCAVYLIVLQIYFRSRY